MIDVEDWKRLSSLIDEAWALDEAARGPWLDALAADAPVLADKVRRALADEHTVADDTRSLARRTGFGQWLAPALLQAARGEAVDLGGRRLGPWRLESLLGTGGMGQVWRARRDDGLFQGEAAIKLLRGDLGSSALAARFARERALLARLNHPAIARLLDAGIAGAEAGDAAGQAYLVLELATGEALNRHARERAPLLAQRVRLLLRVAEAVEYAHARLVVHRDLKPSNVVVDGDGNPKLLDFGIAALLDDDAGVWAGGELTRITGRGLTPAYAAPEQITGAPIGTAADVFSLGVMLYELCTGAMPFGAREQGRTAMEHAVLHDEPRRLAQALADPQPEAQGPGRPADAALARGDLEAIAAKALRKDPAERYAGARGLIEDLQAWLDHRPVRARSGNWQHRTRLWLRRHALLTAGAAVVLLSLGAGLGTSLWQRQLALRAAQQSDEVTLYLEELLASASPDNHGGSWPTVLQLLERSRSDLAQRFADSPETRLRVQQVLLQVYRQLNRLDVAIPLGQLQVQDSDAHYGSADLRSLRARYELAQSLQLAGQCDQSVQALAPALPLVRKLPAEHVDGLVLQVVSLMGICQARLGQLDAAESLLDEEQRLVATLPADNAWHVGVLNHLSTLRVAQGRPREALEALRRTEPFWRSTEPQHQREIIQLQRNVASLQMRLGQYDGLAERLEELRTRADRTLGAGNQLGTMLRLDLARLRLDLGDWTLARQQFEATLEHARAAGITRPVSLLPLRAQALAARTAAAAAPAARLLADARALRAEAEPLLPQLGSQRGEIGLALVRVALAQDDAALAAEWLEALAADAGLRLQPGPVQDRQLAARKEQLDGQLARLRGEFDASRRHLLARLELLDREGERRRVQVWSAALDLAYTLVLAGSAEAELLLADAATRRPAALAAGHPLDAATAYLQARRRAGRDDAPEVQQALAALRRAQQRDGPSPPPPVPGLRASLGGALI